MQTVEVTTGEFLDRYTILRVKAAKLSGEKGGKAKKILDTVEPAVKSLTVSFPPLRLMILRLCSVNEHLWVLENKIRLLDCSVFPSASGKRTNSRGSQGEEYMLLARAIYQLNDQRSMLKAEIDVLMGDQPEIKDYGEYDGQNTGADQSETNSWTGRCRRRFRRR